MQDPPQMHQSLPSFTLLLHTRSLPPPPSSLSPFSCSIPLSHLLVLTLTTEPSYPLVLILCIRPYVITLSTALTLAFVLNSTSDKASLPKLVAKWSAVLWSCSASARVVEYKVRARRLVQGMTISPTLSYAQSTRFWLGPCASLVLASIESKH